MRSIKDNKFSVSLKIGCPLSFMYSHSSIFLFLLISFFLLFFSTFSLFFFFLFLSYSCMRIIQKSTVYREDGRYTSASYVRQELFVKQHLLLHLLETESHISDRWTATAPLLRHPKHPSNVPHSSQVHYPPSHSLDWKVQHLHLPPLPLRFQTSHFPQHWTLQIHGMMWATFPVVQLKGKQQLWHRSLEMP